MIKNKRGWLRIVEAFVAVLIIASVLIILVAQPKKIDRSEEIHQLERHILEQVAMNETIREEIVRPSNPGNETANILIRATLPTYWDFTTTICDVDEVCGIPFYVEKEVYADEILISSTLETYSPKKFKLFIWEK